jgi:hypothetical protein
MALGKDHEFSSIGSFWIELSRLGQICPFSPTHVPRPGSLAVTACPGKCSKYYLFSTGLFIR